MTRLLACALALASACSAEESGDPFTDGSDDPPPSESLPRPIPDEGRRTLRLLESVTIPPLRLTADTRHDAHKILNEQLAKHGVSAGQQELRKKHVENAGGGPPDHPSRAGYETWRATSTGVEWPFPAAGVRLSTLSRK